MKIGVEQVGVIKCMIIIVSNNWLNRFSFSVTSYVVKDDRGIIKGEIVDKVGLINYSILTLFILISKAISEFLIAVA